MFSRSPVTGSSLKVGLGKLNGFGETHHLAGLGAGSGERFSAACLCQEKPDVMLVGVLLGTEKVSPFVVASNQFWEVSKKVDEGSQATEATIWPQALRLANSQELDENAKH